MRNFLLTILFIIQLLFLNHNTQGQDIEVRKKTVEKILKDNANGKTFKWQKKNWDNSKNSSHLLNYDSWLTCNDDSAYHKKDTIIMFNYGYYYFKLNCTWLKEWTIKPNKKFVLYDSQPPLSILSPYQSYKIKTENDATKLIIYNNSKITDSFIILHLELIHSDKDSLYSMTVLREKKH